jgi:hypothetical protein
MSRKSSCLAAALGYLRRGWSVVPVCPADHLGVGKAHGRRCTSPGKAPLVAWKPYQDRPPTVQAGRAEILHLFPGVLPPPSRRRGRHPDFPAAC